MNKDKKPILFDEIEWGNTDNDILNPKWNYKNAAKERMSNESIRKKISETIIKKQSDPKYLEHMSRQRLESMDKPIDESGITLREKIAEANRKSAVNPIHHANRTKANRRMRKDPKWIQAQKQGCWETYGVKIMTPYGEYPCMREFSRTFNLTEDTAAKMLKGLPHLFYKVGEIPNQITYERFYHTPWGKCYTIQSAYELAKKNKNIHAIKLKNIENCFYKMSKENPNEFYITFEPARFWKIINKNELPIGLDLTINCIKRFTEDKVIELINKSKIRCFKVN